MDNYSGFSYTFHSVRYLNVATSLPSRSIFLPFLLYS